MRPALSGLPALPLLALLAVTATALSGCTSCQPLLDVRHCLDECPTGPEPVEVVWTEADAEAWPDVDRLLRTADAGEHEHMEWSRERAVAFWEHYGVEGEERDLVVHREDEQYRVRVLTCD